MKWLVKEPGVDWWALRGDNPDLRSTGNPSDQILYLMSIKWLDYEYVTSHDMSPILPASFFKGDN